MKNDKKKFLLNIILETIEGFKVINKSFLNLPLQNTCFFARPDSAFETTLSYHHASCPSIWTSPISILHQKTITTSHFPGLRLLKRYYYILTNCAHLNELKKTPISNI